MPGARRTVRSVLAVAVTVGALRRELPACGCGPADLVAAPSPEGSRPAGLGMPPAPESARCPPTPPGLWQGSRVSSRDPSVVSRSRVRTWPGRTALARPEGVPLKPLVEKVVTATGHALCPLCARFVCARFARFALPALHGPGEQDVQGVQVSAMGRRVLLRLGPYTASIAAG
jgi:hypothetical protein